jgi:hypothetical protein
MNLFGIACSAACDWKSSAFQGRRRSQHALCRPACDPHSPQPVQYNPCLHPGVSKLAFERGAFDALQFVCRAELYFAFVPQQFLRYIKIVRRQDCDLFLKCDSPHGIDGAVQPASARSSSFVHRRGVWKLLFAPLTVAL